jgi:phosphatidylglycerol phospholipase C
MARLSDVLEWLTQPGLEAIWMVLDIKTDDDPDQLMPAIARTLAAVPPAPHGRAWSERVVVGAWNVRLSALL